MGVRHCGHPADPGEPGEPGDTSPVILGRHFRKEL